MKVNDLSDTILSVAYDIKRQLIKNGNNETAPVNEKTYDNYKKIIKNLTGITL